MRKLNKKFIEEVYCVCRIVLKFKIFYLKNELKLKIFYFNLYFKFFFCVLIELCKEIFYNCCCYVFLIREVLYIFILVVCKDV